MAKRSASAVIMGGDACWPRSRGWSRTSCGRGSSRFCRTGATLPLPGPQAPARSGVPVGDPLRPAHRDPLAGPPARARLRLGGDLLAAPGGVAGGRGVGAPAPAPADRAARRRPDRLLPGHRGLEPGPGQKGGAKTGPSPVDRGRPGSKHHLLIDAAGVPLAVSADRRQPQRRHPAHPAGGRACRRSAASVGPPAPAPRRARGRPRLRPRLLPPPAAPARHPARSSPAAGPPTAPGSGACAGRSSAAWPGCTSSAASWCASSGGPTSTRRSSALGCCLICLRKLQGSF